MPPPLETARIRLRAPHEGDIENIHRLGSNPRVMRYITAGKTQSRQEAERDLQLRMAANADELGYWIAERKSDRAFIGWMALKKLESSPDIEIGYRFLEEFWGKGYATEGGREILHYAFARLELERIVAVALEDNRASTRVMEKLGMTYEGTGRFYGSECVCYAIERDNWLENRLS